MWIALRIPRYIMIVWDGMFAGVSMIGPVSFLVGLAIRTYICFITAFFFDFP